MKTNLLILIIIYFLNIESYQRQSLLVTQDSYINVNTFLRPVLPFMYAVQYLPSFSKTIMRMLGAGYFAKVRDSRNAIEEKNK